MDESMLVGGTAVLLRSSRSGIETLLICRPDRGSFAGAWVFPGGVVEDDDVLPEKPEHETAARAAARECEEEVGLRPENLVALSCWVPPIEAPKRVRTWFFVAESPDGEVRPAPDEVVDARWLSPADALRLHADGVLTLFPPTWVTLNSLSEHATVADALGATGTPELYTTHLVGDGVFAWAGDVEHPGGGVGAHRLQTSVLPWTYRRD